jgi:hypothetical protein
VSLAFLQEGAKVIVTYHKQDGSGRDAPTKPSRDGYKTKRPRLGLSRGTYVDQPSPKCCSMTILDSVAAMRNGSNVPHEARVG